jgi:hypothetical protein
MGLYRLSLSQGREGAEIDKLAWDEIQEIFGAWHSDFPAGSRKQLTDYNFGTPGLGGNTLPRSFHAGR